MAEATPFRTVLRRSATDHERAVVRWLLEQTDPKYASLADQIDNLQVVSKCNCGCPSVDFEELAPGVGPSHLISDQLGIVDGEVVGVMLFERGGHLSMLEVYSFAGADNPFGLPSLENLLRWDEVPGRTDLTVRGAPFGD